MDTEKKKKPLRHLFFIRLIAGLIFLIFGVLHLIKPENFKNILIATDTPMVQFNLYFVPIVEIVVGAFYLLGFLTRLSGIVGAIVMAIATWSTLKLMHLTPDNLPHGLKEVPFSPPIFIPIILLLFSIYLIIMGAGAWSVAKK
ncbi:MAG: DoxX family protein [Chlamydiia bacterium]|nr:DoxX family protein [Chlamydiia bacterium]